MNKKLHHPHLDAVQKSMFPETVGRAPHWQPPITGQIRVSSLGFLVLLIKEFRNRLERKGDSNFIRNRKIFRGRGSYLEEDREEERTP